MSEDLNREIFYFPLCTSHRKVLGVGVARPLAIVRDVGDGSERLMLQVGRKRKLFH
ncbi:hypothetical protein SCE1572_39660 [Sorangium cellulosum So0157-2]|uniref:Uncharacterized protein n=1 Tax=Sorangium cellulosum So0157-2 TaxID=1254432 RepID=S4Y6K3_SORCE|nr:hypothetical protein SCE1572_39660 [Sorangium cellulosum So0157-2]